jgi:3-phosphoshikimate 1-carboxyvinyltransferase
MARVVEPLRLMGATVLGREGGRYPPLAIRGSALRGIDYTLPVASAQVKSALLLAGLYAGGPTMLQVPGPARDHTERMLRSMGCHVLSLSPGEEAPPAATGEGRVRVGCWERVVLTPPGHLQAIDALVPGDASSAAFVVVAAALVPGSEVTIRNVGINPTRTGLLDALQAMGAQVTRENERAVAGEPVADLVIRYTALHGTEVGGDLVVRMIDELPILAVAATQAQGETVVRDAAELRVKETDRIETTVQELRRLGAEIEERPDGFVVQGPTRLRGTTVTSHGDHRLAMALAVAGLVTAGETEVDDVDCIADSFPGFEATLKTLGGSIS